MSNPGVEVYFASGEETQDLRVTVSEAADVVDGQSLAAGPVDQQREMIV